jgi:iron-sulfur cluster assembly accessory protein
MLEELDIQTITVSPAASNAISNIISEKKLEGYALRVFVANGGCCGVNFGMALENNIRNEDITFDANGVKVVVD